MYNELNYQLLNRHLLISFGDVPEERSLGQVMDLGLGM